MMCCSSLCRLLRHFVFRIHRDVPGLIGTTSYSRFTYASDPCLADCWRRIERFFAGMCRTSCWCRLATVVIKNVLSVDRENDHPRCNTRCHRQGHERPLCLLRRKHQIKDRFESIPLRSTLLQRNMSGTVDCANRRRSGS